MRIRRFDKKKILLFLSVLGPGIITASVDNDAGGIATYSIAGAHFGYALLWTLIPITVALIVVPTIPIRRVMYSALTRMSGTTKLRAATAPSGPARYAATG